MLGLLDLPLTLFSTTMTLFSLPTSPHLERSFSMVCHASQLHLKRPDAYISLLCGFILLQDAVQLLIAYSLNQRDLGKDLHEIQSTHFIFSYMRRPTTRNIKVAELLVLSQSLCIAGFPCDNKQISEIFIYLHIDVFCKQKNVVMVVGHRRGGRFSIRSV
jgi:hypothetical protein